MQILQRYYAEKLSSSTRNNSASAGSSNSLNKRERERERDKMVEEYQHTPNLLIQSCSTIPSSKETKEKSVKMMSAVLARGPHKGYNLHSNSIPIPKLSSPHDVILKVEACGICASDGKMYNSNNDFYWHPKTGRCCCSSSSSSGGVIPGHEFVGRIIRAGSASADINGISLKVHQRIVVEPTHSCQECTQCLDGDMHKCSKLKLYGQGINGGMGQYMLVHGACSRMHIIPEHLNVRSAVLCEPLSVSMHAVDRARDALVKFAKKSWRRKMSRKQRRQSFVVGEEKKGDDAVEDDVRLDPVIVSIGGCGMIGLGVIIILRHLFPDGIPLEGDGTVSNNAFAPLKIIAIDCGKAYKLNVAKDVGADICIDVANPNQQHDMACDVYFEASGNPSSILQGIQSLRPCGRFIHLGISDDDAAHSKPTPSSSATEITSMQFWNTISAKKELEVYGSSLGGNIYDFVWERTIQMLSTDIDARVKCERLVTHSLPLKYFREGHEIMIRPDLEMMAQSIKIVIEHDLDSYCCNDTRYVKAVEELVRKEHIEENGREVVVMTRKADDLKGFIVMQKGCSWPTAWKMHDSCVSAEEPKSTPTRT